MYYFIFGFVGFSNMKDVTTKNQGSTAKQTGHCARSPKFEGLGFAPDLFTHSQNTP